MFTRPIKRALLKVRLHRFLINSDHRNSQLKVSIIIPIYNAEATLRASIDSALQQTLEDIEIICVNDGSRDSSEKIAQKYTSKDERVHLISHSVNQGEGSARNTGLNEALGQYVFHLDADDTIPLNALELLYSVADMHDSDMVKGSFALVHSNDDTNLLPISKPPPETINTNIYKSAYLQTIPTSHCSYLYKRSFLNDLKIRYRTDLTVGQDLVMLTTALIQTKKVSFIPGIVYHYYQTQESATRGVLSQKVILDGIKTKIIIYDLLTEAQLPEAATNTLRHWAYQILEFWVYMAQNMSPEVCINAFSKFRAVIPHEVTPWQDNVAHQFRYTLALIVARKDREAIEFLRGAEIKQGFSNLNNLKNALEFTLTQVPNDSGALHALDSISKNTFTY